MNGHTTTSKETLVASPAPPPSLLIRQESSPIVKIGNMIELSAAMISRMPNSNVNSNSNSSSPNNNSLRMSHNDYGNSAAARIPPLFLEYIPAPIPLPPFESATITATNAATTIPTATATAAPTGMSAFNMSSYRSNKSNKSSSSSSSSQQKIGVYQKLTRAATARKTTKKRTKAMNWLRDTLSLASSSHSEQIASLASSGDDLEATPVTASNWGKRSQGIQHHSSPSSNSPSAASLARSSLVWEKRQGFVMADSLSSASSSIIDRPPEVMSRLLEEEVEDESVNEAPIPWITAEKPAPASHNSKHQKLPPPPPRDSNVARQRLPPSHETRILTAATTSHASPMGMEGSPSPFSLTAGPDRKEHGRTAPPAVGSGRSDAMQPTRKQDSPPVTPDVRGTIDKTYVHHEGSGHNSEALPHHWRREHQRPSSPPLGHDGRREHHHHQGRDRTTSPPTTSSRYDPVLAFTRGEYLYDRGYHHDDDYYGPVGRNDERGVQHAFPSRERGELQRQMSRTSFPSTLSSRPSEVRVRPNNHHDGLVPDPYPHNRYDSEYYNDRPVDYRNDEYYDRYYNGQAGGYPEGGYLRDHVDPARDVSQYRSPENGYIGSSGHYPSSHHGANYYGERPGRYHPGSNGSFRSGQSSSRLETGDEVLMVEICPGIRVPLRRTNETVQAVSVDFYQSVPCIGCSEDIFCIADVSYVICPVCRSVGPVEGDFFEGVPVKRSGLGLGFTCDTLCKMQAEILQGQRHSKQDYKKY